MRFELTVNEKDSLRALGQVVHYQRLQKKLSLRDLGSLANISHTLISNIEKGKVVSHPDTLKELLKVLGITFQSDSALVARFKILYDEAFNYVFEYEYDKASKVLKQLTKDEELYMDSIVMSDYLTVKFLFLALTDQIYGDVVEEFESFYKMYDYLGVRQQQILNLSYGICKFNHGLFIDAAKHLQEAKFMSSEFLDLLIDVYMVKSYVKMFKLMDAISLSERLINRLEKDLLYLRAIEVRLSVVYAYLLVEKYDKALLILNKCYRHVTTYKAEYIKNECELLYTSIYYREGKYDLARKKLKIVETHDLYYIYVGMRLAHIDKDINLVKKHYKSFLKVNDRKQFLHSEYLIKVIMNDLEMEKIEDKELLKMFHYLIKFGKRSFDLELLDTTYTLYINHCRKRKLYKKALELSEEARGIRLYSVRFENK